MCRNELARAPPDAIARMRRMEMIPFPAGLAPAAFFLACAIALLAGFVKGATGFAMPMIMISGLASFLSPELALAALILPTLATNLQQAFRDGVAAAIEVVKTYRLYFAVGGIGLVLAGQLVTSVDARVIYGLTGLPITFFGLAQLAGWRPVFPHENRHIAEVCLASVSGVIGGISGVWGPPLVLYLTALDTPKGTQVRTLGVAFGLASVLLLATHVQTGVLNRQTLPLSGAMLLPALLGMWSGQRVHDRLDQRMFQKATLVVLVLAGLNLLRRALA